MQIYYRLPKYRVLPIKLVRQLVQPAAQRRGRGRVARLFRIHKLNTGLPVLGHVVAVLLLIGTEDLQPISFQIIQRIQGTKIGIPFLIVLGQHSLFLTVKGQPFVMGIQDAPLHLLYPCLQHLDFLSKLL
jgi:hypothetical protein